MTKPRITMTVVLTAAGGMWLAPVQPTVLQVVVSLLSIALVVSAANSMNCYLERDVDRLMKRTMGRPLPAERLAPRPALVFSLALGLIAIPALYLLVNPITGILGALSLGLYVGVYTPMKQRSSAALFVGAVPGAMPPLMGWTAATGAIEPAGLVLFGTLYLWQLPHFLAIATFRQHDYTRAGHKVLPAVFGRHASYVHGVIWAALLVPTAAMLQPLGVAGFGYTAVASLASLLYLAVTVYYLRPSRGNAGARRVFVASLFYLPAIVLALLIGS